MSSNPTPSRFNGGYHDASLLPGKSLVDDEVTPGLVRAVRLLEQAAIIAMERRLGAACDALVYYNKAMRTPTEIPIDFLAHGVFTLIHGATQFELSEVGFAQPWFRDNLQTLIPGARLADGPRNRLHIPDFWVEVDGGVYPVEVEAVKFNKHAVCQLGRYMKVFDCPVGYGVARELTAKLGRGMRFVKLDITYTRPAHYPGLDQ